MPFGGFELLIILVIILLFFGASRVPQLGRSVGESIKEFRKGRKDEEAELEQDRERRQLPRDEGTDSSVESQRYQER